MKAVFLIIAFWAIICVLFVWIFAKIAGQFGNDGKY